MTPRERAEQALTILSHETGTATIHLSGLTLTDVHVDLGQRLADAIADAEEDVTREWVDRYGKLQAKVSWLTTEKPAVAPPTEPMNLRMFRDDETGRWFIRGFGYGGSGMTPEDAMRDLAMSRNTFESDRWPVRRTQPEAMFAVDPVTERS